MNAPNTLRGRSGRCISLQMLEKKMEVRGILSFVVSSFPLGRAVLVSSSHSMRLTSCPPASLSPWGWAGVSVPACSIAPDPMPSLHFALVPIPLSCPPWEGLSEGVSAPFGSTHFYEQGEKSSVGRTLGAFLGWGRKGWRISARFVFFSSRKPWRGT